MTLKKDGSDELQIVKGPSEHSIQISLFRPECNVPEIPRTKAEFVTACHFGTAAPIDMSIAAVIDSAGRVPLTQRSIWFLEGHLNDPITDDLYLFTATYDVVRRTGTIKIEKKWWDENTSWK